MIMNVTGTTRKAFTLIELLIVVAIIAILAAIAVPNFLEAQVRSKVSRSLSDLRTVATGLEIYAVDNVGKYPYTQNVGALIWVIPGGAPIDDPTQQIGGLTSPISYLTTIPVDPFGLPESISQLNTSQAQGSLYYEKAGLSWMMNGTRVDNRPVPVPADAIGNGNHEGIGADVSVIDPFQTPSQWVVFSVGPDLRFDFVDASTGVSAGSSRWNLNNRYDSSNGTITPGNIVRFQTNQSFP